MGETCLLVFGMQPKRMHASVEMLLLQLQCV